jgi:hypothetical protein
MTIDNRHWMESDYRQRMTVKEWREILLNNLDTIVFRGTVHKLTVKHLGNGVVEMFKLVETKP